MRSDFKKCDSLTLENHLIRNFLRNGRVRVKKHENMIIDCLITKPLFINFDPIINYEIQLVKKEKLNLTRDIWTVTLDLGILEK